jgi:hypothetical protein
MLQTRLNSISPAMTAVRLNDDGFGGLSGCRSPAALHLETGGDTPNPFGSPSTSTDGPARSPPAAAAAQSRMRAQRSNTSSLATRALSSLNPARASGVIGNIFGGGGKDNGKEGSKQ